MTKTKTINKINYENRTTIHDHLLSIRSVNSAGIFSLQRVSGHIKNQELEKQLK